jgi:aryl-alcohol dehydrogenase-like predicted oxidoreductase
MTIERRALGRSGLQVSRFGFGLMTFGDGLGPFRTVGAAQNEDARRQVALAIEAGVNFFDTADVYSRGRSEEILAQALGTHRKDVVIATKVFGAMGKGDHDVGLSRRHLVSACNDSLKRLDTDWIDLYQVHNFDGMVPLEETLRALDDLVAAGKVRYIGCSNHFAWQLTKALGVSDRLGFERYISQQIQYSLLTRDVDTEILPAGIDQGVGAIIWSPLAHGYLTGKFARPVQGEARLAASGQLSRYDTEAGRGVVKLLETIAAEHEGATPGQVALNWLLARPGVTSVLIGARTEQQLTENLRAAAWALTADEVNRLDRASAVPAAYPRSTQGMFHPDRNASVLRNF